MKTRRIEKHDKSGTLLGYDNNHKVMETIDDVIELLRSNDVTVGDCNSGYSVRRQRELAGTMTQGEKQNAVAQHEGFVDWSDMMTQLKAFKASKSSTDQNV